MQPGLKDPQSFYEEPIGQVARRTIFRRVRLAWPVVRGERLLGYGYALPYLRPFVGEAERVAALVPAHQELGAVDLPFVAQGEEDAWPFIDSLFDRILVVHGLECADSTRALLRQIWRVLAPEGKLICVVPNRASLWSQIERSPFAHGRPFSKGQIESSHARLHVRAGAVGRGSVLSPDTLAQSGAQRCRLGADGTCLLAPAGGRSHSRSDKVALRARRSGKGSRAQATACPGGAVIGFRTIRRCRRSRHGSHACGWSPPHF